MTLRCENASFYNFKKEIWLFNNAELIVRRRGLPVDCTTIKPYMKSNGSAKLPFGFLFCVIAQNISKRAVPERVLKPSARAFGERKIHSAFA